ncbi:MULTISPECIES: type II 3-dehydroquinate dehydratase [Porphyromonas]|uniref:3-dehydroquinate dehydratase n=2 Tax=Porphyromonas circumdentaria TaxID=29524 RepID=A0A1T4NMP2_9PORP|nr:MULTISPECIES: type II 3-dehydroquinate dehydratase [Porphyromonas]SJZ80375.1 3-dehydroquinate dehydratase [Porphyromonas circumdentaria]
MTMRPKRIAILDGPNLNKIGVREPHIYGTTPVVERIEVLKSTFPDVLFYYRQSNHEGVLIDWLHELNEKEVLGIVLNAGAYTHTSIALADAIRSIQIPVVEVHISNVAAREEYRHHSYLSPVVVGTISGFGVYGYHLAVLALLNKLSSNKHVEQIN